MKAFYLDGAMGDNKADVTISPFVLWHKDLQNKIQLVIDKWEHLVMNACRSQPHSADIMCHTLKKFRDTRTIYQVKALLVHFTVVSR